MSPSQAWDQTLVLTRENVSKQQYDTRFQPIAYKSFDKATRTLLIQVPSPLVYEYLKENYIDLLSKVLRRSFCDNIRLKYRIATDQEHHLTQDVGAEQTNVTGVRPQKKTRANQPPSALNAAQPQRLDPNLNPHLTFNDYIGGDSNELPRSVGMSVAKHPNKTQFNPMFIYDPPGCGKTHLINAIGMLSKQLYPQKRVLYVSARLFQVQYTNTVLQNSVNDFINFYQATNLLIIDDMQEWMTATKTQDTFFHVSNHLSRNGKHIILANDRPPVDLKGMSERLLARFACGLVAELERPSLQLCINILDSKIQRDGLQVPDDVVQHIAQTTSGGVRDLQGVINSLLAYSIIYNSVVDMRLAQRVIQHAVEIDDEPLIIDEVLDTVRRHFGVTVSAVNGKSRKQELVTARQLSMCLAQKYTKIPASCIGKLMGGRDHSTVIHSCTRIEQHLKLDSMFSNGVMSVENSFRLEQ